MPKRSRPRVPVVPDIDLEFRPRSYWADQDPIEAIVQNIKGQNRREMARDFIAGDMPKSFGEIDDSLIEDTLSADARVSLGHIHPSFMGGEYLPDYGRGEVEIARVVLESSTQDVYSFRARRSRAGARIRYRLVDEYEAEFTLTPASSARPLSLGQLIALIDSAESDELDTMGWPFVEGFAAWQIEGGESPEDAAAFASVESSVYPQLGEYYAERMSQWAAAQAAEREDEDEDEHGDDASDEDGDGDDDDAEDDIKDEA